MDINFQQWIDQAKAKYRTSPLSTFVDWWKGELVALLPETWKSRLMPHAPALWLVIDTHGSNDVVIWGGDHGDEKIDVLASVEDQGLLQSRWQKHLSRYEFGKPKVTLCLPPETMLDRTIEMPAAVQANLANALQYQLDQFTPFEASSVYFDQKVLEKDESNAKIRVDLRLVPRQTLDPILERLKTLGIVIHAVDRSSADTAGGQTPPKPEGFNLLPMSDRVPYRFARTTLNWRLAGAATLSLVVMMVATLLIRQASEQRLADQVAELRLEAQEVMALQRELSSALDAANFLAEKRASQPVIVPLLEELTRLLPEDMWFQQVQVRGDEIIMMGFAEGSQQLIEIINESSLLSDATFRGRVTVDPETNQERFTIQATIQRRTGDAVVATEGQ